MRRGRGRALRHARPIDANPHGLAFQLQGLRSRAKRRIANFSHIPSNSFTLCRGLPHSNHFMLHSSVSRPGLLLAYSLDHSTLPAAPMSSLSHCCATEATEGNIEPSRATYSPCRM